MTAVGEMRQSYVVRDNETTNRGLRLVPRPDGAAIDVFDDDRLVARVSPGCARELALGLNMMCDEMEAT